MEVTWNSKETGLCCTAAPSDQIPFLADVAALSVAAVALRGLSGAGGWGKKGTSWHAGRAVILGPLCRGPGCYAMPRTNKRPPLPQTHGTHGS